MTVTEETAGAAGTADAADPVLDMRPRLRHDVLFADIGDGVVLRNAKGGYVIKGRTAYRFTSSLAPFLTGDLTVAQLCADLTPERTRMIADFVRTLVDRGFARDVRGSRAVDLPAAIGERFAPQVSYVEHYVDDAAERFLRFRTTRVLVLGSGPIARAAALSLLRNGLETVSIAGSGSVDAAVDPADELLAQATELRDVGCPAFVRHVDIDPATITATELAAHDVVVAPAQDIGPAALLRLNALVSALPADRDRPAVAVLPAAVVGDAIVLGPVVRPAAAPCWSCAALRLGANGEATAAARLWRDVALPSLGPERAITPQLSAMVGTMLAFDLFRLTTGALDAETDGAIIAQNVHTLESRREELPAHPLCPHCADHAAAATSDIDLAAVAAAVPGRPAYEPPDKDGLNDLLARFEKLASRRVGIVSELDDMPLQQSPVKASRVVVGSPRHPGTQRRVLAFDLHYVPIARREAVHAALLAYVGEIADTRGAVDGSLATLRAAGHDVVAPHDLVTATGLVQPDADRDATWLAATSLTTGARLLAPAAAVHPFATVDGGHGFERSAAGDGAGSTLADAVAAGVLSALAYEALVAAASGAPGRALTVGEPPVGSELEFLARTLANLELDVELIDIAPDRPARVVLARVVVGDAPPPAAVGSPPAGTSAGTPDWHVGVGLDLTSAVVDALLGIVGKEQARRDDAVDAIDDATAPGSHGGVDLGRPLLADLDPRVVRVDGSADVGDAADREFATVGDVLRDLAARGQDAYAVPTTTPDLAAHGVVETARVLLRRAR